MRQARCSVHISCKMSFLRSRSTEWKSGLVVVRASPRGRALGSSACQALSIRAPFPKRQAGVGLVAFNHDGHCGCSLLLIVLCTCVEFVRLISARVLRIDCYKSARLARKFPLLDLSPLTTAHLSSPHPLASRPASSSISPLTTYHYTTTSLYSPS